jgi:hypothetical protein
MDNSNFAGEFIDSKTTASFDLNYFGLKNGKDSFCLVPYGRFLSRSIPTTAMAIIIATTPATK